MTTSLYAARRARVAAQLGQGGIAMAFVGAMRPPLPIQTPRWAENGVSQGIPSTSRTGITPDHAIFSHGIAGDLGKVRFFLIGDLERKRGSGRS